MYITCVCVENVPGALCSNLHLRRGVHQVQSVHGCVETSSALLWPPATSRVTQVWPVAPCRHLRYLYLTVTAPTTNLAQEYI